METCLANYPRTGGTVVPIDDDVPCFYEELGSDDEKDLPVLAGEPLKIECLQAT